MKITVKESGKKINSKIFGIFFEDINYALDGGLYAEMLENRNFEFQKSAGNFANYSTEWDGGYAWSSVGGGSEGIISFKSSEAMTAAAPHSMKIKTINPEQGVENRAYEGVALEKGEGYQLRLYAKTVEAYCRLQLHICDENGIIIQNHEVKIEENRWKEYVISFHANENIRHGKVRLILPDAGEVELSFVSLIPQNAVAGIFRKDIYETLSDLEPSFVRFPGGCIVEGSTLSNRYQWKDSIGPDYARKNNWNRWAVHDAKEEQGYITEFSHYNQSLGIGFYEYFLFCELLKAKPIPIVSVGLACQYHTNEKVDVSSDEFDTYIQDALDLIEFANGDENSAWGKKRIEMGHKEPFGMEYIGIGNEQWESEHADYYLRYKLFEVRIHEKYPDIKLVGSVGPDVTSEKYHSAWNFFRKESVRNKCFTAMIDEHYYLSPEWFLQNSNFYDAYPRTIDIFAGEYAAHTKEKDNNWEAALSEAAFMTGLVKNADVVRMAAYAPLLARRNFAQWKPDLIWFDDKTCVKTPNYYVQQLFSKYTGDFLCDLEINETISGVYVEATRTADEKLYVKIINTNKEEISINLHLDNLNYQGKQVITLHAPDLTMENNFDKPQQIVPRQINLGINKEFFVEAYACQIYVFE